MTPTPPPPTIPEPVALRGFSNDSAYSIGVQHLVSDQSDAMAWLSRAVAEEPNSPRANIALACAYALDGNASDAIASCRTALARRGGTSRRERQQVEILAALLDDRPAHALDLTFEHLEEYGPDPLVVHVLATVVSKRQDPALSSQLDALRRRVKEKAEGAAHRPPGSEVRDLAQRPWLVIAGVAPLTAATFLPASLAGAVLFSAGATTMLAQIPVSIWARHRSRRVT